MLDAAGKKNWVIMTFFLITQNENGKINIKWKIKNNKNEKK